MSDKLRPRSISDLFGLHFYIPAYQRGYRWSRQQVHDLLEDIYTFARKKKNDGEFYCLQPIVVKQCIYRNRTKDKEDLVTSWEVADGQQRLTTIRIILQYILDKHFGGKSFKEMFGKNVFEIDYETRDNTEEFLKNIKPDNEYIDFYYISKAYSFIEEWFEAKIQLGEKPRKVFDSILNPLAYGDEDNEQEGVVKVIWYQLDDDESGLDSFIRINLGKIPLTNSELIKALLLQKRNFGDNDEAANLRQIEIATKWDRIENALQNDDFWLFLNKIENTTSTRIDFIFNLLKDKALTDDENHKLQKIIGTDRYSSYRYFQYLIGNDADFDRITNYWNKVDELFMTLEDWFSDPEWYHYIGFLIFQGTNILDIYNVHEKIDAQAECRTELETQSETFNTKQRFTESIKGMITSSFSKLKWKPVENKENTAEKNNKKDFYIDVQYNSGYERRFLLLYNLEYIVRKSRNNNLIYKFPFKQFKEECWDVEHVDSFTENNLSKKPDQTKWIEVAKADLNIADGSDLGSKIMDFLNNKDTKEKFEALYDEITKTAGEDKNDDITKNGLGNLVLLDAETNREYKNALFVTKRKVIIEKDIRGKFIPICTKNVFLKYFDLSGTSKTKWTEEDIVKYRKDIENLLERFLPQKPLQNG